MPDKIKAMATVTVPLDATDAMVAAALGVDWTGADGDERAVVHNLWHVMCAAASPPPSFQSRVSPWMLACFGAEISADTIERNHRFLEEALELVQSTGCTASEAHQLVDYVFGRPVGDSHQEIGGVMVTLAALCLAIGEDMHAAGETELARIWTKVEQIRAKQAAKPKHSPLPGPREPALALTREEVDQTCGAAFDQGRLSEGRRGYLEGAKLAWRKAMDRAAIEITPAGEVGRDEELWSIHAAAKIRALATTHEMPTYLCPTDEEPANGRPPAP